VYGREKKPFFHLAQDGEPADLAGAALRHLRLPHRRGWPRRLLPRARTSCIRLGAGARPLQKTTSRRPREQLPSRSTPLSRPAPSVGSSCRSAAARWTRSPNTEWAAHALYKDGVHGSNDGAPPNALWRSRRKTPTFGCAVVDTLSRATTRSSWSTQARAVPDQVFCFTAEGPGSSPCPAAPRPSIFRLCRGTPDVGKLLRPGASSRRPAAAHTTSEHSALMYGATR